MAVIFIKAKSQMLYALSGPAITDQFGDSALHNRLLGEEREPVRLWAKKSLNYLGKDTIPRRDVLAASAVL